ncbi:hypothetical protein IEO21_03046 [Rhodonia placenta]|uniref:Uncharacterized protein n=1 Tax=Rhodonia placenta TaxID=104341 RepID=A0A8H7P6I5_9APHY|nr:hypothetical protein IEO21_03046 [Postia placenta]
MPSSLKRLAPGRSLQSHLAKSYSLREAR